MAKALLQSQFHKISREIKDAVKGGYFKSENTAANHSVSTTTVNTIKRVKTWPAYQAHLLARHESRKVTPAEKQLTEDLAKSEQYISRDEFSTALKTIHTRLNDQLDIINTKQNKRRSFFGLLG